MENIDLLISEEAQQDMDQVCFCSGSPPTSFFAGYCSVIPNRAWKEWQMGNELLLKAPIGLRAPHAWCMPHEVPGVFHALLRHSRAIESG